MKSLFETDSYNQIKARLNALSNTSEALWGKMNVGQMCKHCQVAFNVANGDVIPNEKIGSIKKFIFSLMKPLMYNDKPWKKNIPTGKDFIITEEVDFSTEKEKLLALINDFHSKKNKPEWAPHPVFGKFTPQQYGKMMYKHLDHHFTQFGV